MKLYKKQFCFSFRLPHSHSLSLCSSHALVYCCFGFNAKVIFCRRAKILAQTGWLFHSVRLAFLKCMSLCESSKIIPIINSVLHCGTYHFRMTGCFRFLFVKLLRYSLFFLLTFFSSSLSFYLVLARSLSPSFAFFFSYNHVCVLYVCRSRTPTSWFV